MCKYFNFEISNLERDPKVSPAVSLFSVRFEIFIHSRFLSVPVFCFLVSFFSCFIVFSCVGPLLDFLFQTLFRSCFRFKLIQVNFKLVGKRWKMSKNVQCWKIVVLKWAQIFYSGGDVTNFCAVNLERKKPGIIAGVGKNKA